MKKWMLMLCFLLFFDVQMIGGMRDKTSLSTFRQAGMPVELFQKMGMKAQDMEQYLGFWEDLKYFPVAGRKEAPKEVFYFEDTWLEDRNYGGKRAHQGCDVFGKEDRREYYPVVSMTDGVVETVGWLPLGGWRIGIRSPGGGFFYYAHLSSYEKEFQEGDAVKAGGNSGFFGRYRVWGGRNQRKISLSFACGNLCEDAKGSGACSESVSCFAFFTEQTKKLFLLKTEKLCYTLWI